MSELVKRPKHSPNVPNFEYILLIHSCKKVPIATTIYSVLHCTTLDPCRKFHSNPLITCSVMLLTHREKDRHTDIQTDRQTNATENRTLFAKDLIILFFSKEVITEPFLAIVLSHNPFPCLIHLPIYSHKPISHGVNMSSLMTVWWENCQRHCKMSWSEAFSLNITGLLSLRVLKKEITHALPSVSVMWCQ